MESSDYSDVFVSYRRKDVDFAKKLVASIQAEGKECWIDWEDIPPGSVGFSDDIKRGLEGADAFIAILSPDYLESTYCVDLELQYAIDLKKKLIPIVLKKFDDYPVPGGIGHINWIYFTPHAGIENDYDTSLEKVMQALNQDLEHARAHKRFMLRALEWDSNERNNGRLLTKAEITEGEAWLNDALGKSPHPTDLHKEYILESRNFSRQQQRRLLTGVSVALVVSIVFLIAAIFMGLEAQRQKQVAEIAEANASRRAEVNNSLALAAAANQPANANIAVALALEATRIENPPPEIFTTLMNIAYPAGIRARREFAPHHEFFEIFSPMFYPAISPDAELIVLWEKLYDVQTGELLATFSEVPQTVMYVAEFLPDGKHVILAGDAGVKDGVTEEDLIFAALYSLDGELIRRFPTGFGVSDMYITPDGVHLMTYLVDGRAMLWDIETGEQLGEFEQENGFVAISPDMTLLTRISEASNSPNNLVEIVDLDSEEVQHAFEVPPFTYISSFDYLLGAQNVRFSPDSSELLFLSPSLASYDVQTGQLLQTYSGHDQQVRTARYSANGEMIVSVSNKDVDMFVWNRHTGEKITELDGHEDPVLFADFADETGQVVSFDQLGNTFIWDVRSGDLLLSLPLSRTIQYQSLRFNDELNHLVTLELLDYEGDMELVIREQNTWEEISRIALSISSAWLNADGSLVLSTLEERAEDGGIIISNHVTLQDSFNGDILAEIEITTTRKLQSAEFATNGTTVLFTLMDEDTYESVLALWNWETGQLDRDFETADSRYSGFVDDNEDSATILLPNEDEGRNEYAIVIQNNETDEIENILATRVIPINDFFFYPADNRILISGFSASGGGGGSPSGIDFSFFNIATELVMVSTETNQVVRDYGQNSWEFWLNSDETMIANNGPDDGVTVWRIDTLELLIDWTCANRYVAELSTEQRETFRIENTESICSSE